MVTLLRMVLTSRTFRMCGAAPRCVGFKSVRKYTIKIWHYTYLKHKSQTKLHVSLISCRAFLLFSNRSKHWFAYYSNPIIILFISSKVIYLNRHKALKCDMKIAISYCFDLRQVISCEITALIRINNFDTSNNLNALVNCRQ